MSVTSHFDKLPQSLAHIAKRGASALGAKMFSYTNAIFEKLIGSSPPGGQSLSFFPHDHGYNGGVPIARNNLYSFDTMSPDRWQVSVDAIDTWYRHDRGDSDYACPDTSPPDRYGPPNFMVYVSPGIDSSKVNLKAGGTNYCKLEAKMLFKVNSGFLYDYEIRFYNRTTQTYSSIQGGTIGAANYLLETWSSEGANDDGLPCRQGVWNEFDVECRSDTHPGDYISIFQLIVSETRQSSQPVSAGANVYDSAAKP